MESIVWTIAYDVLLDPNSTNRYASNSVKKYFDIIKNDDLSSLYEEIYSKIIAQDGFLVERISFTYMYSD